MLKAALLMAAILIGSADVAIAQQPPVPSHKPALSASQPPPVPSHKPASSASQPPSPSLGVVSGEQQQKRAGQQEPSANDKRGTRVSPLIVEMSNPPNTDAIAAEYAKDRDERAANERRSWIFTVLLVGVGMLQGCALIYTAIVTNKAANAARASADALPKIERAYIFVHPLSDTFDRSIFDHDAKLAILNGNSRKRVVKINLANWGNTPAAILEIPVGLIHREGIPAVDGYTDFPTDTLRETVIAPATPFEMDITDHTELTADHLSMLEGGSRTYFLQGRVRYHTVIDDPNQDPPRETTFCWRYDFGTKVWAEWGGSAYNYRT